MHARRPAIALLLLAAACESGATPAVTPDAPLSPPDAAVKDAPPSDGWPTAPDAMVCSAEIEEDRGLLAVGTPVDDVTVAPCTSHRWTFVAAAGARVRIELGAGPAWVEATLHYPDAPAREDRLFLLTAVPMGDPAGVTLEIPRSGEFVLLVRALRAEQPGLYSLAVTCESGCDLEATRYPIVLVHGWTGWNSVGPYEYFYGVPESLREHGYAVHVATLDPYNSTEVRSVQLAAQVDAFLLESRSVAVNLIAHSQGGLDSRRLISTLGYGDRVSALVMIASPHHGTPLCDVALGYVPGPGLDVAAALLNLLGAAGGNESDAEASFHSMSQTYVDGEFNPANPDDPRVSYVSWTGLTCRLGEDCGDVVDVEIALLYEVILAMAGDNDGVVPVASAVWGDYRGTVPADHFDEIGQLAGVTNPSFDHREFYLSRARDLAAEGH